MLRKTLATVFMASALFLMSAMPVFAGTWVEEGTSWKYYNSNGQPVVGWIQYNENWYYTNPAGDMVTGWIKDEGKWYYMHDDGTMAHDTWIDNYYVNASGRWVKTR